MEQRNLKINQISAKKTPRIRTAPSDAMWEPRNRPEPGSQDNLQSQVLSWDGMAAALSFSVPFAVVIAINFQSALALALILAAVLLPITALRFSMREKLGFPDFLTAPVCALASVGITAFASVIIRNYFPQINDSLGIYIYLLAAYPVAAAVFLQKPARKLGTAMAWALRNLLYFSCAVLLAGIFREFLAYNRLVGLTLPISFKLEAAKMPFFGFIVLAFLLAAATRIHMAVKVRFPQPALREGQEASEAVQAAEVTQMDEAALLQQTATPVNLAENEP